MLHNRSVKIVGLFFLVTGGLLNGINNKVVKIALVAAPSVCALKMGWNKINQSSPSKSMKPCIVSPPDQKARVARLDAFMRAHQEY